MSATFSGTATFLCMRVPKNVAAYKKWLHFVVRKFLLHFMSCYISGCNKAVYHQWPSVPTWRRRRKCIYLVKTKKNIYTVYRLYIFIHNGPRGSYDTIGRCWYTHSTQATPLWRVRQSGSSPSLPDLEVRRLHTCWTDCLLGSTFLPSREPRGNVAQPCPQAVAARV